MKKSLRCGNVAIIGPANAGKSTLLNATLDDKVSIVSNKPHTTRNAILGVKTLYSDDLARGRKVAVHELLGQIVFLDTPGFVHKIKRGRLKNLLGQALKNSMRDSDLTMLVLDVSQIRDKRSFEIIFGESRKFVLSVPDIIVLNKIDLKPQLEVLPTIKLVEAFFKQIDKTKIPEIVPISGLKKRNIKTLLEVIYEKLPEGELQFPEEETTNQTDDFFISELIREKVFIKMREEIPYSVTVHVEKIERKRALMTIFATIIVERDGQKGIIIGAGGQTLKEIGTLVRIELEESYGTKINLQLSVKVDKKWVEKE